MTELTPTLPRWGALLALALIAGLILVGCGPGEVA